MYMSLGTRRYCDKRLRKILIRFSSSPFVSEIPKSASEVTKKSAEASKEEAKEGESEKDKDEAATRIQAAFRGHHARKSMKEPDSATRQPQNENDPEPTQEQLLEEFRADDKGKSDALTFSLARRNEVGEFSLYTLE